VTVVWKLARDGVASKRSVTNAILGLMAYKQAFNANKAILDTFFYA